MFFVTVMYPAGPKFDLDYYVAKHMTLLQERWGSMGMNGAYVVKGTGAPSGEPTYQIITTLTWTDAQAWQRGVGAHGAEIMGDIPNFFAGQPAVQFGEAVSL